MRLSREDEAGLERSAVRADRLQDGDELQIGTTMLVLGALLARVKILATARLLPPTPLAALLIHVIYILHRDIMLFDEFSEQIKVSTNDRGVKRLRALRIEAAGSGQSDRRVTSEEAEDPVPARFGPVVAKVLGALSNGPFAQRSSNFSEMLDPFDQNKFLCRGEELLCISSLRTRLVNVFETSMQSRVRHASVHSGLLDIDLLAILDLPEKGLARSGDLLFLCGILRWHATRRETSTIR